jgi:hypothetical protein
VSECPVRRIATLSLAIHRLEIRLTQLRGVIDFGLSLPKTKAANFKGD